MVSITVSGVFPQLNRQFEAIIDTGYTGFLSMPIVQAFPLGLLLYGTTNVTLADASQSVRLTGWGNVSVGEEREGGVIILEPNASDVLIGMDLLRRFHKSLIIRTENNVVGLIDDPLVVPGPQPQEAQAPAPPQLEAEQNPPNPEPPAPDGN